MKYRDYKFLDTINFQDSDIQEGLNYFRERCFRDFYDADLIDRCVITSLYDDLCDLYNNTPFGRVLPRPFFSGGVYSGAKNVKDFLMVYKGLSAEDKKQTHIAAGNTCCIRNSDPLAIQIKGWVMYQIFLYGAKK